MTPSEAAQLAIADIEWIATVIRNGIGGTFASIPSDDAAVLVDGTQVSPSWRALNGGAIVWDAEADDDTAEMGPYDAYVATLDAGLDGLDVHGWTVTWEDGCLWAVGPGAPSDLFS